MPDSRLKLAFVVDRFGSRFGGAEAYGVALMRELAESCDITVIARDYDPDCGITLPYVPIKSWKGWPSWCRVLLFAMKAGRLTAGKFDIVHSHVNGWCGDVDVMHVTPARYKWRTKAPSAWQRLGSYFSPRILTYLGLETHRARTRRGHRTIAVSELIARELQQAYRQDALVQVIPPGTSDAVPDPAARAAVRQAQGWRDTDVVCLLVSRNPLRKGLAVILKALGRLPPHVKLLVVGEQNRSAAFVRQHASPEVAGRVRLIDETSDVSPYYAAADIYVHPTLNDSYGMAPLEAMSFGLPVVVSASPWCGLAQYLENGQEALVLSQPEDPDKLAGCIHRIVGDDGLRQRLSSTGKRFSRTRGWPGIAGQYRDVYQDILAERHAQPADAATHARNGGA